MKYFIAYVQTYKTEIANIVIHTYCNMGKARVDGRKMSVTIRGVLLPINHHYFVATNGKRLSLLHSFLFRLLY